MTSLDADRANRRAARALFEQRWRKLRDGLIERPIKTRMVNRAKSDARDLADQALDVAQDNKGIVAAAVAALLAWAFRAQLLDLFGLNDSKQATVQPEPANDDGAHPHEEQTT